MHSLVQAGPHSFHHGRVHDFHGGQLRGLSRHAAETEISRSSQRVETLESDGASARKLVAKQSELSVEQSGFDSRRDFVRSAKKLVRGALKSLAKDVGQAFESVGLEAKAGKTLIKGLIKPLVQAIRQGVDFTAQVRLAAVQKTTVVSGAGVSESLSVVAKSVDISVNHATGEISLDVKKLEIEQDSHTAVLGQPAAPQPIALPPVGEGDAPAPPGLGEIVERALEAAKARDGDEDDDDDQVRAVPDADALTSLTPAIELLLPNAEGGEAGFEATRSRIRIDAAQQLRNEAGELITRLRLDARISLTRVLESEPETVFALAAGPFRPSGAFDIRA